MFVEHKGSLKDTLVEMQQDLQSSISYAGGKDLKIINNCRLCYSAKFNFNGDKD